MKIQWAIATELIISWVALLVVPTLLVIVMPLIDKVLTPDVINSINGIIDNIEYFIWSTNTNILFACIWIILIIKPIKWMLSFFKTH